MLVRQGNEKPGFQVCRQDDSIGIAHGQGKQKVVSLTAQTSELEPGSFLVVFLFVSIVI